MPNVYDFDKTVVYPDSGFTFFGFCFRRHWFRMLRHMPRVGLELLRFALKRKNGSPRGNFYVFLRSLPDWREEVRLFWEQNADAMLKPWYLKQKRPDDIIISCTAHFLLEPMCEQLGVRLLATEVCLETYRLTGHSCYGHEKVRRFHEAYPGVEIDEFYSDSLADSPLANIAKQAFFVIDDEILPWPDAKSARTIQK